MDTFTRGNVVYEQTHTISLITLEAVMAHSFVFFTTDNKIN